MRFQASLKTGKRPVKVDPHESFMHQVTENIAGLAADKDSRVVHSSGENVTLPYNFSWFAGVPVSGIIHEEVIWGSAAGNEPIATAARVSRVVRLDGLRANEGQPGDPLFSGGFGRRHRHPGPTGSSR
jgi:hypothetical protein